MADILCVNGWAQPPDGLSLLAPGACHLDYRPCDRFADASDLIHEIAPRVQLAIGWSLGGSILMRAAACGALRAERLALIAPPVQFVADAHFPWAMDAWTFRQFYENYQTEPERTASRFSGLIAKGDRHARRIMGELGEWPGSHDLAHWLKWLDQLAGQKFNDMDFSKLPPTLILHGRKDSIVSWQQSHYLSETIDNVRLSLWDDSGHAPHLHDREAALSAIQAFAALPA